MGGNDSNDEGYGTYRLKATPALADITDLGMLSVSGNDLAIDNGLIIKTDGDAQAGERNVLYLKHQNPSLYHMYSTRFSTTNVNLNYIRLRLRDNNGTHQSICYWNAGKDFHVYRNIS